MNFADVAKSVFVIIIIADVAKLALVFIIMGVKLLKMTNRHEKVYFERLDM